MNKPLLALSLIVISLWSCKKEQMGDCFKSTGKNTTESRNLTAFSQLELHDRIELNYHYSSKYWVKVSTGENLIDGIQTKVEGNLLKIENENRCNWVRSFKHKVQVDLYAPSFSEFTYYGSGTVQFIDTLKTDFFNLELWQASGNLHLKLNAETTELKSHTGPGDIFASGKCVNLVAYLNGIGRIEAPNLISQKGLVINRKTGNILINCQSEMQAEISGQGNIEYIGNPVIDYTNSGSGELIQR
ncbi:MAG: head GIN domain-containing protein [Vicingaceae bacterium]